MKMIGAHVGSVVATEATPVSSSVPAEKDVAEGYGTLTSGTGVVHSGD